MGSGLFGTDILKGRGFFGFDPTPGYSATQQLRGGVSQSNTPNAYGGRTSTPQNVQKTSTAQPTSNPKNASGQPGVGETPANPGSIQGAGVDIGDDLAYLDDQEGLLRGMLGRSQGYLNQGLTNLTDSYNRELGSANQQRSRAMEDFGVQREDTVRGRDESIGRVDTNARTLNDSLRRILGQAAGSSSSAYKLAAPNAVARQASLGRNDVMSDYAENERDLGLAERRADEDFGSLLEELSRSRSQRESELRGGILESEQGINEKLAGVAAERARLRGGGYSAARSAMQPFRSEIDSRQAQLDSLFERFRSPTLAARPLNVQTPTLRDYMVDKASISANNSMGQQPYSPYSQFLRRPEEEEQLA